MSSIAEFLQQQRTAYQQALPARLDQLDAFASQLDDPVQAAAALAGLERHAHSLAGSAGTFGHADLGVAARALELAVEEARASGSLVCLPGVLAGVQALRQQFLAALASAAGQESAA